MFEKPKKGSMQIVPVFAHFPKKNLLDLHIV